MMISTDNTNAVESQLMESLIQTITCPITGDVMHDPVQGNDGSTYERTAIIEWLTRKQSSPTTNIPMTVSDLKVNANIRYLCDKYHAGQLGNKSEPSRPPPKVSTNHINLVHKQFADSSNEKFMLSFNIDEATFPDVENGYLPHDIMLVMDRSGSMGTTVQVQDENGKNLEHGFNIQDIVNHAVKTVIKTVGKDCRIGIIAYDNLIEVQCPLTVMTEISKNTAIGKLDNIVPRGQTNIYGALEKAIEILDERDNKSNNSAIILFTDGSPNISPARGEVETLKKLRVKKNFTSPIYTMGFGYGIQPSLLYDMAKCANGSFGHIPDGGMIATVFCNYIATILSTVVMNLQLHIISPNVSIMGDYNYNFDSSKNITTFDLGTVQRQQTREIIFDLSQRSDSQMSKSIEYYFTYKIGGVSYTSDKFEINNSFQQHSLSDKILENYLRSYYVESLRKMTNYASCNCLKEAEEELDKLSKMLNSEITQCRSYNKPVNYEFLEALKDNLDGNSSKDSGQIKKAITNREYYNRWGKFYVDQLSRALLLQIKPNFKDSSCMKFGGDIFMELVDHTSDIFDSLPPPQPSNVNKGLNGSGSATYRSMASAPPSMTMFNNRGGGCYLGTSEITLANGMTKYVKDLVMGDMVVSCSDESKNSKLVFTKVLCVVKTIFEEGVNLVNIGKLEITQYHPIYVDDEWKFPVDYGVTYKSTETEVYNIVLEKHHIAIIDSIPTICLGHNYNSNKVLSHPYYGSQKVINDLKKLEGFNEGLVTMNSKFLIREDNLVSGYKVNEDIVVEVD